MPKVSLSGMTVEALMDLRKRVDETLHRRRAELEKQLETMRDIWRRKGCPRPWDRIERKKSPAEILWSVRRDLGRSWRKTPLACCCDQRWKEAR